MISQRTLLPLAIVIFSIPTIYGANQKYKLGDVPNSSEKKANEQKALDNEGEQEENARLVQEVAEEFYQKGLNALTEGNFEQAEGYFDRVLILKPNHKGTRDGIEIVMKKLEERPASDEPNDCKKGMVEKMNNALEEIIRSHSLEESE